MVRVRSPGCARHARTFADAFDPAANNFDALRFLLAACVIVSHCFTILYHLDPLSALTSHQAALGGLAVNGFFVISGFLIARSWENSQSLIEYFARRARRIYPAFIVSSLFCLLVVGPIAAPGGVANVASGAFAHVRRLVTLGTPNVPGVFQGTRAEGHVNPVVWSIRYEFLCYALVPVLAALGVQRRRSRMVVLLAVVYSLNVCFMLRYGFLPDSIRVFGYFATGMTFWLLRDQIPVDSRIAGLCAALIVVTARSGGLDLLLPGAGSYLLLVAACHPGRLNGYGKTADLSYGMYLYGFPIQLLLMRSASLNANPVPLALAAAVLSVLFAAASWRLVESPFLHGRRRG